MSPKRPFNIMLEPRQIDALRKLEEATGAKPSEQIRRAIDAWIKDRGVTVKKTERKRAATRKRS